MLNTLKSNKMQESKITLSRKFKKPFSKTKVNLTLRPLNLIKSIFPLSRKRLNGRDLRLISSRIVNVQNNRSKNNIRLAFMKPECAKLNVSLTPVSKKFAVSKEASFLVAKSNALPLLVL